MGFRYFSISLSAIFIEIFYFAINPKIKNIIATPASFSNLLITIDSLTRKLSFLNSFDEEPKAISRQVAMITIVNRTVIKSCDINKCMSITSAVINGTTNQPLFNSSSILFFIHTHPFVPSEEDGMF